jgi:hypothetical protein
MLDDFRWKVAISKRKCALFQWKMGFFHQLFTISNMEIVVFPMDVYELPSGNRFRQMEVVHFPSRNKFPQMEVLSFPSGNIFPQMEVFNFPLGNIIPQMEVFNFPSENIFQQLAFFDLALAPATVD